jgi:hypothetical protein
LATRALRAYAVGAAFSTRDVADEFAWRPTDPQWTDVEYRRVRPPVQPKSDWQTRGRRAAARRRSGPVATVVDPSRIRTPEQQRAVARRVANAPW